MTGESTLAMQHGLSAHALGTMIHPYPTYADVQLDPGARAALDRIAAGVALATLARGYQPQSAAPNAT